LASGFKRRDKDADKDAHAKELSSLHIAPIFSVGVFRVDERVMSRQLAQNARHGVGDPEEVVGISWKFFFELGS
jgi:hypothetical protein